MKKISTLLLMFTFLTMGISVAQTTGGARFVKNVHDYGKIAEEAGKATCFFDFENTGTEPIIINSVRASCGCTAPSYTEDPILPGKYGRINVAYSTTNRVGAFNKQIKVFTSVPDTIYTLTIKGEVLPPKAK